LFEMFEPHHDVVVFPVIVRKSLATSAPSPDV
jgi:hypothetical protein